jgi:hypothetical protein
VKERTRVFVIRQVLNQLPIAFRELGDVFPERHTRGIHHRQIIAKRLQKLYLARLEHVSNDSCVCKTQMATQQSLPPTAAAAETAAALPPKAPAPPGEKLMYFPGVGDVGEGKFYLLLTGAILLYLIYSLGAARIAYNTTQSVWIAIVALLLGPLYYPYYGAFLSQPPQTPILFGGRRRKH